MHYARVCLGICTTRGGPPQSVTSSDLSSALLAVVLRILQTRVASENTVYPRHDTVSVHPSRDLLVVFESTCNLPMLKNTAESAPLPITSVPSSKW